MAEKEERILIARSTNYTLTDTDKGELFEGKIEPHCANVFTRQSAINLVEEVLEEGWWSGKTFRQLAEAALNALSGK